MSENKILRDLDRGFQPELALARYAEILGTGYMKLAYCKLADDLVAYYDDLEAAEGIDADRIQETFRKLLTLIERAIAADAMSAEDDRQILHDMRNALCQRMQQMYSYVHILSIYEHIMNRLQYQYRTDLPDIDLDELMMEFHNYICKTDDPAGVNQRIQNILSEMPIRMTKSRFLDLAVKSCNCYRGTRSDIADYFFNDMYLQAKLPCLEELNPEYDALYALVQDMEAIDFGKLDQEAVEAALDRLQKAGEDMALAFACDFQLLELMNDLYILILNMSYVQAQPDVKALAAGCIDAYMKAAGEHNFIGMEEDIVGDIRKLNDIREKLSGLHMLFEDQLLVNLKRYDAVITANGMADVFKNLRLSMILSGIHLMAELNADEEIFITDRDYIAKKTDKLISIYTDMFGNSPMIIRRAIIAEALGKLPVAFDSLEENEALIRQSFENCKDKAERHASIDMIRTMMTEKEWQE